MRRGAVVRDKGTGGWQQAIAPLGTVAAGFTTLSCLGMSAAVSLSTSVGATFLTRDSALRPLLAASLVVTVAGSALSFWRHRGLAWPLVVTIAASVAIYSALYVGLGPGGMGAMAGDAPAVAGAGNDGLSNGRQAIVWASASPSLKRMTNARIWPAPGRCQKSANGSMTALRSRSAKLCTSVRTAARVGSRARKVAMVLLRMMAAMRSSDPRQPRFPIDASTT